MGRETLIESRPWENVSGTGTITVTSGSDAVAGVGTSFTTQFNFGAFIYYTDDAGAEKVGIVKNVVDDTNLTLYRNANSTATSVLYSRTELQNVHGYYFIGDNTALKSLIIKENYLNDWLFTSLPYRSAISKDEGILLKTFYVRLPYQYTMADSGISVNFGYVDPITGDSLGAINTVGEGGGVYIPGENGEVEIEAYIPPPTNSPDTGWALGYAISNTAISPDQTILYDNDVPAVSQVDAPDALNNIVLPITVGARILHASVPLT